MYQIIKLVYHLVSSFVLQKFILIEILQCGYMLHSSRMVTEILLIKVKNWENSKSIYRKHEFPWEEIQCVWSFMDMERSAHVVVNIFSNPISVH